MIHDGPLPGAHDRAWSVYRARRREVDAADAADVCLNAICRGDEKRAGRRRRTHGLRYRLPRGSSRGRMLSRMETIIRRVCTESAKADWRILTLPTSLLRFRGC